MGIAFGRGLVVAGTAGLSATTAVVVVIVFAVPIVLLFESAATAAATFELCRISSDALRYSWVGDVLVPLDGALFAAVTSCSVARRFRKARKSATETVASWSLLRHCVSVAAGAESSRRNLFACVCCWLPDVEEGCCTVEDRQLVDVFDSEIRGMYRFGCCWIERSRERVRVCSP